MEYEKARSDDTLYPSLPPSAHNNNNINTQHKSHHKSFPFPNLVECHLQVRLIVALMCLSPYEILLLLFIWGAIEEGRVSIGGGRRRKGGGGGILFLPIK